MQCPREMYLVVSRSCKEQFRNDDPVREGDAFFNHTTAQEEADCRNDESFKGCYDWRVEKFVKGD